MQIKIDEEFKQLIPSLSEDEYANLEQSLLSEGCRDSLVVWNGIIIDGHNRYDICTKHGLDFETMEKPFDSRDDVKIWMLQNQLGRRNLIPYLKAGLVLQLAELYQTKAKDNKINNSESFVKLVDNSNHICQNSDKPVSIDDPVSSPPEITDDEDECVNISPKNVYPNVGKSLEIEASPTKQITGIPHEIKKPIEKINTNKELAKIAGLSHDTIARVKTINEKAPEEVKQQLRDGELSINKAYTTIIRKENEEKQKEQQEQPNVNVEFPNGKFKCLVIDPPWDVKKILRDSRPNQAEFAYKTMSDDEISELPIDDISADDCHLYLWTTHKKLPTALQLVEKWGFKYQCLMTWVKNVGFTPFSWMYSTEHVLFCRRGNLDLNQKGLRLDFNAKVREHSRKPDEFYNLVLKASPEPRLELFSREPRQGFETWGNETNKFSSRGKNVD